MGHLQMSQMFSLAVSGNELVAAMRSGPLKRFGAPRADNQWPDPGVGSPSLMVPGPRRRIVPPFRTFGGR